MNLNFKDWLLEAAPPPAPMPATSKPPAAPTPAPSATTKAPATSSAPTKTAAPASGGGGGGGGGGGSAKGGLFGTGTAFKYTPSNSNRNNWAKTPEQWYKKDMANKFNKGCSGSPCPKSLTG